MARYVTHWFPMILTKDGQGGFVKRAFPTAELKMVDPFVTFDLLVGPWGSTGQRGIPPFLISGVESLTYLLEGDVRHAEQGGSDDLFSAGCARWLDAGRGAAHFEAPSPRVPDGTNVVGVRLWLALPPEARRGDASSLLVNDAPQMDLPGAWVRTVSGPAPGSDVVVAGSEHRTVIFQHWELLPGADVTFEPPTGDMLMLAVLTGTVIVGDLVERVAEDVLALCQGSGALRLRAPAGGPPVRLILFSAPPLNDSFVRFGSIVAASKEEVDEVIAEANAGRFEAS